MTSIVCSCDYRIFPYISVLFVALLAGVNARCSLARGRYQRGRVQFPNSDDSVWCTMPPSGQVIHYELQIFNNKTSKFLICNNWVYLL